MKKLTLILSLSLLSLITTACGKEPCSPGNTADTALPNLLIIGDSISLGYTPFVQQQILSHDVVHNVCNGKGTRNGLANIDAWIAQRPTWDLITFNHGRWDAEDGHGMTVTEYGNNLRILGTKLLQASPKVLFFNTTMIPSKVPGSSNSTVLAYNQKALDVMNDLGIPVYDLYSVSVSIPQHYVNYPYENDVHFTPTGSQILSGHVINFINTYL